MQPKADIQNAESDVRYVPKADINSGITPTEKPQHLAGEPLA